METEFRFKTLLIKIMGLLMKKALSPVLKMIWNASRKWQKAAKAENKESINKEI